MRKKSLSVVQAGSPLSRALPTTNEVTHTPGHIDCPACEQARAQMIALSESLGTELKRPEPRIPGR